MTVWLILIGMGLVTYATRLAFILFIGRVDVPESVRGLLGFVPPAVLGAIIFMGVLLPDSEAVLVLSPLENLRIPAAGLAIFVAWRTKKILPTIVAGIVSLWILQAVLG
ncbi:MAG: AzlD domain-containing protein [Chloroflexi bacterium]|jgi:branched-subunit amino acid transport protein|nr:AzlD domain-containing protein [Chloroflexota bacterium]